jgi:large subunit ribosomal protein L17
MKKNVFGRQLKRDTNERKALFKNLLTSLVMNEQIKTTTAKAKAIRGAADKLITKAKLGGREAYRGLEAQVNHDAVLKLIDDLGPRFNSRNGGYTRIIKIGNRVADNAPMALMEWVEKKVVIADKPVSKDKKEAKPAKKTETKKAEVKVEKKAAPKKKAKKESK